VGIGRRAGPLWLPHLIGSGTPEGDRFSRAALVGVQIDHDRGDLFRGLLESLSFWLRHNLDEMSLRAARPIESISLTGGVTRLNLLSQLKADVLGRPVRVTRIPETAAAGAALLAGLGTGVFASAQAACACLNYPPELLEPNTKRSAWYAELYQQVYRPLYASLDHTNHALQALSERQFDK
jgi:xylulokinase